MAKARPIQIATNAKGKERSRRTAYGFNVQAVSMSLVILAAADALLRGAGDGIRLCLLATVWGGALSYCCRAYSNPVDIGWRHSLLFCGVFSFFFAV